MAHWDECENCQKHERPGVIHVYGQDSEHQEVHIVGDVKALEQLRDAINTALDQGLGVTHNTTTADGEGYYIHVVRHETDRMSALTLPYFGYIRYVTDPSYSPKGRYPSSLVPIDEHDEILADEEWFEAQRKLGFDYRTGKVTDEDGKR
jgi:hypothetical protein